MASKQLSPYHFINPFRESYWQVKFSLYLVILSSKVPFYESYRQVKFPLCFKIPSSKLPFYESYRQVKIFLYFNLLSLKEPSYESYQQVNSSPYRYIFHIARGCIRIVRSNELLRHRFLNNSRYCTLRSFFYSVSIAQRAIR